MALETGTYISDLVSANPAGTDTLDKADDHLRLIKSTVKATFPNLTGAVTPTHADLNKLTSAGSPQFSTIELGAATDTTISRSAAGIIAVEGVTVPLNSVANIHTAQQLELGHASDTTLTRSAAGLIAVEGGVVPLENRANTFTAEQTTTIDNAPGFKARALSATAWTTVEAQANDYASGPSFKSTFLRQYSPSSAGTLFGLSNANLGTLQFQNGSAGLIGTNGGAPLVFGTVSVERLRIDTSGRVGIGRAPTNKQFEVAGQTWVQDATLPSTFWGNTLADYSVMEYNTSTKVGTIGVDGATTQFAIRTVGTERLRVDASGNVLVTGAGGLGYGTGSGGTVTQLTSKATGVTLNKTNGQIISHNAALAAAAEAAFTVTNSTVAATDTIIVSKVSGGASSKYDLYIGAVAAGSFDIVIRNVSGTSGSDVVTMNFAVIKAVTA